MQAQNTLNYAVQLQRNKHAFYVVFSFARAKNTLTDSYTVTQRIAHAVATTQHTATSAQIAHIVAQQQRISNAASVQDYTNASVQNMLCKNDAAAQQL